MVSKKLINDLKSSPATIGLIKYLEIIERLDGTIKDGVEGGAVYDDTALSNRITALEEGLNNNQLLLIKVEGEDFDLYLDEDLNLECTSIIDDEENEEYTYIIPSTYKKIYRSDTDDNVSWTNLVKGKNRYKDNDFRDL